MLEISRGFLLRTHLGLTARTHTVLGYTLFTRLPSPPSSHPPLETRSTAASAAALSAAVLSNAALSAATYLAAACCRLGEPQPCKPLSLCSTLLPRPSFGGRVFSLARLGSLRSDRIGSDRIGSVRFGPGLLGSDRQYSWHDQAWLACTACTLAGSQLGSAWAGLSTAHVPALAPALGRAQLAHGLPRSHALLVSA